MIMEALLIAAATAAAAAMIRQNPNGTRIPPHQIAIAIAIPTAMKALIPPC